MGDIVSLPKTLEIQWRRHEGRFRDQLSLCEVPFADAESIVAAMRHYHDEIFGDLPPVDIDAPEDLTLSKEQCEWLCGTVLAEVGRQIAELESRLSRAMELYFHQVLISHGYRAR